MANWSFGFGHKFVVDPSVSCFLALSPLLGCLQLNTLRGSILEDAVPSTSKHGLARGLPLKEVLEYLVPELNVHCLRLALNTPKVTEQLMKLDEQGVRRHNMQTELGWVNLINPSDCSYWKNSPLFCFLLAKRLYYSDLILSSSLF